MRSRYKQEEYYCYLFEEIIYPRYSYHLTYSRFCKNSRRPNREKTVKQTIENDIRHLKKKKKKRGKKK